MIIVIALCVVLFLSVAGFSLLWHKTMVCLVVSGGGGGDSMYVDNLGGLGEAGVLDNFRSGQLKSELVVSYNKTSVGQTKVSEA